VLLVVVGPARPRAVNKRQVINGEGLLHLVGDLFEFNLDFCLRKHAAKRNVGHRVYSMFTVRRLFECIPHFLDIAVSTT
jgi:hypothetical protein